jgi:hypothetical protein
MWRRILPVLLLAACAEGGASSELAPSGKVVPGKGEQFCPVVPAGITPSRAEYSCGPLDATSGSIMTDVNRFWGSQVLACAAGLDFPEGVDGAWSLSSQGVIYVGERFVEGIVRSGGPVAAEYAFAHELGHEIEGHYLERLLPTAQERELTADCLAGYYFGSLVCRGLASEDDVQHVLATACVITDGTGNASTDAQSHGTCDERVASVATGMKAYLEGQSPLETCAP